MAGWSGTQDGQVARIKTALEGDQTFLEGFTHVEALGEPFRLTCEVVCEKRHTFVDLRGTGVSVSVTAVQDTELLDRSFHGLLTEAVLSDASEGVFRYTLTARPWFWILSLGRQSRIFPHMSAQDIIKDVFTKAGVANSQYDLSGLSDRGTVVREYCVQFEESDFAFVSRLMEEEGIYYFFSHTADSHVMMLCDSPTAHPDFAYGTVSTSDTGGDVYQPYLVSFGTRMRPTIAEFAVRDQHFKKFGDPLNAKYEAPSLQGSIKAKVFEYPGGFAYLTDDGATTGDAYAKLRWEADLAEGLVHEGSGNVFALATGLATTINWNGSDAKMLTTRAVHTFSGQRAVAAGEDGEPDFGVEVEFVTLAQGWRPQLVTPKPVARGPQIATVVGTKGKEIETDDYGRVRVQFPWDRYGQSDENSSCWIRVSTGWAGPHMGEIFIPRIGQEVLVDYIEGDMDRPIITGRVYDNKNAFSPPASTFDKGSYFWGRNTVSGWVTQTVNGKSGQDYDGAYNTFSESPGFNYLLFDDQSGEESVSLRSQRELWVGALRDSRYMTERDARQHWGRHLETLVGKGDETHHVVAGKRTTTINKDETLTVEGGNMSTTVETGNQSTKVSKGNQSTEVSMGDQSTVIKMGNQSTEIDMGNQTTDVKLGNISIKADLGKIDIEAMQSITLKVGASTVVIDQMGVTIKGMMIKTEAQMMHETKALLTQVSADAILILKGGITMIN